VFKSADGLHTQHVSFSGYNDYTDNSY